MTQREIVAELVKYIVGQDAAKRAVAIAIRNRWRRQQLPPDLRKDVTPKNIIMIGPTGVGKTEIARRLAQLVGAPFLKIEATKYTEVGYHGRDVESMIRDITEIGIGMVRAEQRGPDKTRASSSSTSWTRFVGRPRRTGRTCRARGCSATCCRSWRARRSTRATGRCARITFCSSPRGRSTCQSRPT